jgi:hypothetical protein
MMNEYIPWIIGQTIIIVLAILGAFVRSRERLTQVETSLRHIEVNTDRLKDDHNNLADKVDGISRHVAIIEGKLE